MALTLLLSACTSPSAPVHEETPPPPAISFAPVYFIHGSVLAPEFIELSDEGEPVEQLFDALVRGPVDGSARTALPSDARLRGEFERAETLHIDPGAEFWKGSRKEISERIAQVTYTMGALEEGRHVRFLFLGRPPDLHLLEGPIDRDDVAGVFDGLIQIQQPAPGSVISTEVPVRAALTGIERASAAITTEAGPALVQKGLSDGETLLRLSADSPSALRLRITAEAGGRTVVVDYPVRFIAP